MRRTGNAIVRAYREGGRRPIIVVGHSAGGIATRLAMAGAPYHGRRAGVAPAVGCLVTLGTPHQLSRIPNRYHHAGHDATDFLDRESPGAFFAPRTSYLTVGSSHPEIAVSGVPGRLIGNFFSIAVGEHTRHAGDGIVPASAVHLEGAEQMTFDDVRHGVTGGPWYGDEPIIDRWWPAALRLWREAWRPAPMHALSVPGGRWRDSTERPRIRGRGVEQRQLVGLITRRSAVRIRPPQPRHLALTPRGPASRGRFLLSRRLVAATGSGRCTPRARRPVAAVAHRADDPVAIDEVAEWQEERRGTHSTRRRRCPSPSASRASYACANAVAACGPSSWTTPQDLQCRLRHGSSSAARRTGNSSRHGMHQLAQKFTITGPSAQVGQGQLDCPSAVASLKSGAGWPINGLLPTTIRLDPGRAEVLTDQEGQDTDRARRPRAATAGPERCCSGRGRCPRLPATGPVPVARLAGGRRPRGLAVGLRACRSCSGGPRTGSSSRPRRVAGRCR